MAEALPLEEDEYAEFYKIEKPVIKFEGGVNEIQHIQSSLIEIGKNNPRTKSGASDQLGREGTVTGEVGT